jgi:hypothetical protein
MFTPLFYYKCTIYMCVRACVCVCEIFMMLREIVVIQCTERWQHAPVSESAKNSHSVISCHFHETCLFRGASLTLHFVFLFSTGCYDWIVNTRICASSTYLSLRKPVGVPAQIRTSHIPNTSQKRYHLVHLAHLCIYSSLAFKV